MTPAPDFPKIYIDLSDCERALSAWYSGPEATGSEQTLHTACEGLLRAVSTLVHGLDRETGAPAVDEAYEAAVADLNPTFGGLP